MNPRHRPIAAAAAALLAAGAAGCQAVATEEAPKPAALSDADRPVADAAIDALAAELRIPREKITVESIRAVDWPNSALGCAKPGSMYLDVITPGHQVTLRADGQVYVVNEGANRTAICRGSGSLAAPMQVPRTVYRRQMAEAQADLAGRLKVPAEDITPVSGEIRVFPDASLGCPEPGMNYTQVQVDGWVLTLRHAGRDYTYHTDLQRTIPCPAIDAP